MQNIKELIGFLGAIPIIVLFLVFNWHKLRFKGLVYFSILIYLLTWITYFLIFEMLFNGKINVILSMGLLAPLLSVIIISVLINTRLKVFFKTTLCNNRRFRYGQLVLGGMLILVMIPCFLKLNTYVNIRALFPYESWNHLKDLEIVPENEIFDEPLSKDSLVIIKVRDMVFYIPEQGSVLKDTFDLNGGIITFEDSTSVVITYDSHIEGLDYIKQLRLTDESLPYSEYFTKYDIATNYDLLKHTYKLKPSDISWLKPHEELLIQYSLLRLKQMVLSTGYKNRFINFETDSFKGFIFDDRTNHNRIIVSGFSKNNKQYSFVTKGFTLKETKAIILRLKDSY